jgi:hypothetical protein
MVTRYILNQDYKLLRKGEVVLRYDGHTYGCIKNGYIAVERLPEHRIKPKNASSFIEVSLEFLDEYGIELNIVKRDTLMTRVLSRIFTKN